MFVGQKIPPQKVSIVLLFMTTQLENMLITASFLYTTSVGKINLADIFTKDMEESDHAITLRDMITDIVMHKIIPAVYVEGGIVQ